ncbi:hypothetical protein MFLAVUS_011259 [Mucor flavus]|uniref:SWIM-type domain-containing protein n=1 Tax=Mucor flavus TaxID=439312 RepID=A0ABP9ZF18_9FUNG
MLCEKKHWVGVYADEFSHMRNRTSNRAEGAHSAINVALGNIPSGKISTVTDTIDRWYILKRDERKRQREVEMLGKRSTLVNKETEHKFEHLMYKITRFAMDFVRKEVSYGRIKANNNNIPSACECICNVIYKLPCYHMLAVHDVIPLSFVHPRWWIDYNDEESDCDGLVSSTGSSDKNDSRSTDVEQVDRSLYDRESHEDEVDLTKPVNDEVTDVNLDQTQDKYLNENKEKGT